MPLAREELFTEFDEVWLCATIPGAPKPKDIRLTSDIRLSGDNEPALVGWMRSANCYAGLGDGDGLNFVTFDPRLASLWRD